MKLDFKLPKIAEVSESDFYVENLREKLGRLVPTGCPPTVLDAAGARNFRLPSGRILSIGDDRHDIFIDGELIGSLGSPFGALLVEGPGDDCIILTTNSAPEWIVDGQLRGKFTPLKSEVSLEATGEMTFEQSVEPLKLTGSYPRASGTLTAPDEQKAFKALTTALESLETRAAGAAMRVQPVWMAWQILDSAGKVISRSEPMLIQSSAGFQGGKGCEMMLTRKDGKFTDCSAGTLEVKAYGVKVKINRSADQWRRQRAAWIEILAGPPLEYINGAQGAFNSISSTTSALYISPLGGDSASIEALKSRTRSEFPAQARVVARIAQPLEGIEVTLGVSPLESISTWEESIAEPNAVCAYRGGSAVVYADARNQGLLLAAPSASPLAPVGSAKVSTGRIHAIMAPVGGSGGWNYGRYHLLVFATDGVYAVSIDRTLKVISSQMLHSEGVDGPQAVAAASDGIYFATRGGLLMRIRGSAVSELGVAMKVSSVAYAGSEGELWLCNGTQTATLNLAARKMTFRTDLHATRFDPESALATDSAGALRDLLREEPKVTAVRWRRRLDEPFAGGLVEWRIDSARISGLELILMVDGGGSPQRINAMSLSGRLNAPFRVKVFSPARPYLTVCFSGVVDPQSRFTGMKF